MITYFRNKIQNFISQYKDFNRLEKNIIELNNYKELMKLFNWENHPIIDRPDIYDFFAIGDLNERRIRDAESLATVMRNACHSVGLEIGTANGMGTLLMSVNSPQSQIYTINIPPEEIINGSGGILTTAAIDKELIGIEYRKQNRTNINQIFANTATWNPNIGLIDIAFIDGCHDTEFVYNDTKKVLPFIKKGGFILWHDFNFELALKFDWIFSVCKAVEKLIKDGLIQGRIFHVKDSWIGIYQVN